MNKRVEAIINVLDDKKAENIESFDLIGKDYMVDYVVLATTLNGKHGSSLLNYLKTDLKPAEEFAHVDEDDNWTVIDLGDILIHLMTKEYRERYNLEEFLASFPQR